LPVWPPADIERFRAAAQQTLQGEEVDAVAFAIAAIPGEDERGDYLRTLRSRDVDLVFTPDPAERQRLTTVRRFEGSHDLLVRIRADQVGPGRALEAVRDPNTGIWTITIKSSRWEEQRLP
jgi:hypothetical protein